MDNNTSGRREKIASGKFVIKIVSVTVVMIILLVGGILLSDLLDEPSGSGKKEVETVDPSKLHETKEEGFDIMEYEEYLNLNRTILLCEKDSGVSYSLDESNYTIFGIEVELTYEIIEAIISGDCDEYNEYVHTDVEHSESFTQQQLYDIVITREGESSVSNNGNSYTEYVVMVEYKIHENNGSFRADIESDASKPQYFVINNSTGEFLVMDIVTVRYAN